MWDLPGPGLESLSPALARRFFFFFFCGTRASHCCGLSRCGAEAPDVQARRPWFTGPAAPRHVGSSRTGARTRVPCIGRWTFNHCATREAPFFFFKVFFFGCGPILKSLLNLLQYCFCFLFWFFGREARGILASQPGIKPEPPAWEVQSLNHWTASKVPAQDFVGVSDDWERDRALQRPRTCSCVPKREALLQHCWPRGKLCTHMAWAAAGQRPTRSFPCQA